MQVSDELFQLIKSLSKSEKRYFKLHSSMHGSDKKYVMLFEAIGKQTEYNEKEIVEIFKKEKFIRQLSVIKNYLYGLILSSLKSYHTDIDSQLQGHLHGVTILYEKGLYRQCEKLIAQAQRLAEKYEKHWFLAELKRLELNIIRTQSHLNCNTENITEYNLALQGYINQYQNINEYLQLVDKICIHISQNNIARNDLEKEELERIIKHPLLRTEKKAISTEALYRYNYIYSSYYYYTTSDYAKSYLYIQKSIALLEANPAYKENKLEQYITTLNNLIICQLQLKHYHDVPQNIQKLKTISNSKKWLLQKWFYEIKLLEFDLYIKTGEFEKGLELIPLIQDKLHTEDATRINLSLELIYHITLIYFGMGDYNNARINLNKILNDTAYDVRRDLYCFAWILQLIVHYELGDIDFINYKVKSTQQFLAKRERLYQSEKIIVDFFRTQMQKAETKKQHIQAFKKLKKQFTEIIKNPFERKALDYFDFISWIDSKIENRSFSEIVREKQIMLYPTL